MATIQQGRLETEDEEVGAFSVTFGYKFILPFGQPKAGEPEETGDSETSAGLTGWTSQICSGHRLPPSFDFLWRTGNWTAVLATAPILFRPLQSWQFGFPYQLDDAGLLSAITSPYTNTRNSLGGFPLTVWRVSVER